MTVIQLTYSTTLQKDTNSLSKLDSFRLSFNDSVTNCLDTNSICIFPENFKITKDSNNTFVTLPIINLKRANSNFIALKYCFKYTDSLEKQISYRDKLIYINEETIFKQDTFNTFLEGKLNTYRKENEKLISKNKTLKTFNKVFVLVIISLTGVLIIK